MMHILVLSKEAWRDEQNGGNVLSNIFAGINAEFAQIYCSESEPNNHICKKYYQMTDRMMLDSVFKQRTPGKVLEYENFPVSTCSADQDFTKLKKYNLDIARVMREIVWRIAKWDENAILNFAKEFSPDIIFAPCYGSHYMLRLTKLICKEINAPVISYISDDFYSNNQFKISPAYWINHFLLRKHIREVFPLYSLVYTMTDEQKAQCEKDFNANMKILRKSGEFDPSREKVKVNDPIKLVYGGGIYLNRYVTLMHLADAIRKVNVDGIKMQLDIYTNTVIPEKARKSLDDGKNVNLHKPVSSKKLMEVYSSSDIALHVEGFDKKSSSSVRLSFSTKIVDCLDSGCAVMAICDEKQAGFAYLKRNDAAICICDVKDIYPSLLNIIKNRDILIEYQRKAFALGRKNHSKAKTDSMISEDILSVLGKAAK